MSNSVLALLGYAAWTMLLLLGIGLMRSGLVLAGKRAANQFSPDGSDLSPFSNRLCRAHANCFENLPIFTAVILVALVMGRNGVTDPLALPFLAARIGQSTTHLASTSHYAVLLRFALFLAQWMILAYWIVRLLTAG
ncbi:MAG: MAPEG family protein [Gammaproteobacteria bacterium]|nr:MAPEG family protein [Gammaproteobacteria bacterium]NNF62323.1 MAPEG family protein [Gammaproteobacteria bacterium]NNM20887.1 MAPEG family protein [Gammaproteobacteria bacterium]